MIFEIVDCTLRTGSWVQALTTNSGPVVRMSTECVYVLPNEILRLLDYLLQSVLANELSHSCGLEWSITSKSIHESGNRF